MHVGCCEMTQESTVCGNSHLPQRERGDLSPPLFDLYMGDLEKLAKW